MEEMVLEAEKREIARKSEVKALRRGGRVPAVAYGDSEAPAKLSLNEKSLQAIIHSEHGRNSLISLKVGGTSHAVLIKEIQRDPITRAILHVDLHRVSLKKKIETAVPVHVKGEAPGVKLSGGVLEHIVREIRVRCLPTDIPSALDVDVTSLQIGQGLKAKDLKVQSGIELLIDLESLIVNVVAPTILEEPTPAATAAPGTTPAEPEVIKKGKTDEVAEGGTAPAAAGAKPSAGGAKPAAASAAPAKPEAKK